MDIFTAVFPTGEVAAATGVSNALLQTWMKRGLIVGQVKAPITGGGTPGSHRRFTFYNVMEIAVIKALVDADVGLSDARTAAMHFAHSAPGPVGDRRWRLPSLPYNTLSDPCFTVLCVAGERSQVLPWVVGEDLTTTARHVLGNPLGWFTLQLNPIFESVVAALGYDYRDVLAQAYGKA